MTLNQLIIFTIAVTISSMWCIGLHVVVKKLVFEEIIGIELDNFWNSIHYVWKKPRFISRRWKLILKPLFACPACMASIWGTLIFWIVFPYMGFMFWIPFCVCLCGLNYFVSQFFVE